MNKKSTDKMVELMVLSIIQALQACGIKEEKKNEILKAIGVIFNEAVKLEISRMDEEDGKNKKA